MVSGLTRCKVEEGLNWVDRMSPLLFPLFAAVFLCLSMCFPQFSAASGRATFPAGESGTHTNSAGVESRALCNLARKAQLLRVGKGLEETRIWLRVIESFYLRTKSSLVWRRSDKKGLIKLIRGLRVLNERCLSDQPKFVTEWTSLPSVRPFVSASIFSAFPPARWKCSHFWLFLTNYLTLWSFPFSVH